MTMNFSIGLYTDLSSNCPIIWPNFIESFLRLDSVTSFTIHGTNAIDAQWLELCLCRHVERLVACGKGEKSDRSAWREAYPLEKPLISEVGVLNNSAGCIHESLILESS